MSAAVRAAIHNSDNHQPSGGSATLHATAVAVALV